MRYVLLRLFMQCFTMYHNEFLKISLIIKKDITIIFKNNEKEAGINNEMSIL